MTTLRITAEMLAAAKALRDGDRSASAYEMLAEATARAIVDQAEPSATYGGTAICPDCRHQRSDCRCASMRTVCQGCGHSPHLSDDCRETVFGGYRCNCLTAQAERPAGEAPVKRGPGPNGPPKGGERPPERKTIYIPKCTTCDDTGEIDERIGGSPKSGVVACPDCQPPLAAEQFELKAELMARSNLSRQHGGA